MSTMAQQRTMFFKKQESVSDWGEVTVGKIFTMTPVLPITEFHCHFAAGVVSVSKFGSTC